MPKLEDNWKEGDLLYGLQKEARRAVIEELKGRLDSKHQRLHCTFDRRIGNEMCRFVDVDDGFFSNDEYNEWLDEKDEDFRLYAEDMQAHARYNSAQPKKSGDKADQHDVAVKRGCKWAIEYAVTHGQTVHFLLDGLNINSIISKGNSSFTNSELRFIYRNREDERFKSNIKFYIDCNECDALWASDDGRKDWEQYKPKSTANAGQ